MKRTARVSSFRRRARRLFKPLAICIGVVVAAGLSETIVRLVRPGFPGFRLPQVQHRPVVGLGFEMTPGQAAFTWASPVTINAIGFRGPELRQPPGDPLVFCVGDSMTFGVGVEDADTYPRQLERLLAKQWPDTQPETINMGVQRYGTFQEMDLLREHAPRLQPDIVTLAVYVNDLGVRPPPDFVKEYENEREQAATALRNVLPGLYWLSKNSAAIMLMRDFYLSRTVSERMSQNALKGIITDRDERRWRGFETELAALPELARVHGFTPFVIFVPARQQVRTELPNSAYPRRLLEYSRRIGLTSIDPTEMFKQELRVGNDPYLAWDDHMSPVGHRLIADALLEQIRHRFRPAAGVPTSDP